jgi:hypothetical protein
MNVLKHLTLLSSPALVLAGQLAIFSTSAFAHHGWNWGSPEQTELAGVIMEITIGMPHPVLAVEAEGRTWRVELDDPRQTRSTGLDVALAVGKEIVVLGHRNADGSAHIKAVRVSVEGTPFDVYPERIQ